MRIAILHNEVSSSARPDESDVLVQVDSIAAALQRAGHTPEIVPCSLNLDALQLRLDEICPDAVFNLVESLGSSDRLMVLVPALLDALRIPYTGSPANAIFLTGDKVMAKTWLRQAGLPTPSWCSTGDRDSDMAGHLLGTRAIIKTIYEHASVGLDDEALVVAEDETALRDAISTRANKIGRPCFAEQYIEGREFNLSLLASRTGVRVLPPAEIDFSGLSHDQLRIVGYDAKWIEDSSAFQNTPRTFAFSETDAALLQQLESAAESCWHLFGLRGYARVDFRVDRDGNPWILEINANPCLSPDAGFTAALAQAGVSFDDAIQCILADTLSPGQ